MKLFIDTLQQSLISQKHLSAPLSYFRPYVHLYFDKSKTVFFPCFIELSTPD